MAYYRYSIVATLLAATVLTGCASKPKVDDAQVLVDQKILDAARKIQAAQADLYQAGALNQARPQFPQSILENNQLVSVHWQGDALQLLNKLAHDRNVQFSFMGVRVPLPVSIDVKATPYSVVIGMLRAQIGYRANLIEEPSKIVLHYNRPQS
ncbi:DotD/TraH family lipoprotein [Pseudomonas asuensis]|uniref:Conjugal transfer protein TraH n=1 Tax=Pseudomonas asuensis TaxID=1825787 RepID=A0ABQ2H321_9PSED|nr:DotD/TraH family lipoprotein [Pseudomonas asuensis]GGM25726.1 conjugal transfer protein TraH [Pseudomonas asuensis]